MTMITGYRLKEGGFLQADILLSSNKSTQMPPSIPTFNPSAVSPTTKAYTVAALCQKILVVNEHFAVAFAGNVPDIQHAARLIDTLLAQRSDLTGERFKDALLADDRLKKARLNAIALSVEDDGIHITNYRAESGVSNQHFELHVGGTGLEQANQHWQQYPLHAFDVLAEDIVVQGTCMALHQFARHVIDEFENKFESETITNLFGGGYEVVAYHSGQLHKISDVVYVYAEAELDADGILQVDFPKFLLKSTYQDNDLKIRSVEIHHDEDEEDYTTRNDRTFTIASITRYRETYVEEDCQDVNLLGEFLCFVLKVKMQLGSFMMPFIRKYDGHLGFAVNAFTLTASKDNVQLIYSDTFKQEIQVHALDFMRQFQRSLTDR